MATKIVCDKCGKEIDIHKPHLNGEIEMMCGYYPEMNEDILQFDLCLSCFSEFKKWLKQKN